MQGTTPSAISHHQDTQDRPIFHIAPPSGWINDPNGPLLHAERYHLFYQHLEGQCSSWGWGLCWGHVSSSDLVAWERHPPALRPSVGGPDAAGCFSGCAVVVPTHELQQLWGKEQQQRQEEQQRQQEGEERRQEQQQQSAVVAAAAPMAEAPAPSATAPAAAAAVPEGASTLGDGGVPVLLYTGVVLRPSYPAGLTPSSLAVSELCYEQQLAAVAADPDDPHLSHFIKLQQPVLREVPPGLCLNCFRDPFILERPSPSNNNRWRVMVGAGIREPGTGLACAGPPPTAAAAAGGTAAGGTVTAGATAAAAGGAGAVDMAPAAAAAGDRGAARGTALVYSSTNLLTGWQFEGHLCTSRDPAVDGAVFECPILAYVPLNTQQQQQQAVAAAAATHTAGHGSSSGSSCSVSSANGSGRDGSGTGNTGSTSSSQHTHMFSVSVGTFPSHYYMGHYAGGKFDLGAATGPLPLDLGDILYAPNIMTDDEGRLIMWAWLCELPSRIHTGTYAGSISLPRLLTRAPATAGGYLLQQPLPALQQLCTQPSWTADRITLTQGSTKHVAPNVPHPYFTFSFTMRPASGTTGIAGFMLPAHCSTHTQQPPAHTAPAAPTAAAAAAAQAAGAAAAVPEAAAAPAASASQGVLLLYDFSTCCLSVSVGSQVGVEGVDQAAAGEPASVEPVSAGEQPPAARAAAQAAGVDAAAVGAAAGALRRLGGKLRLSPGEPLQLQVFLDYSLLEVFLGDGQTLSTRVYRSDTRSPCAGGVTAEAVAAGESGAAPEGGGGGDGGVVLVCVGGEVAFKEVWVSAMRTIWKS